MLKKNVLTALFFLISGSVFCQTFFSSEYLKYNVEYAWFRLGVLEFHAEPISNSDLVEATITVKSNPSLPFVDLDWKFKSTFDQKKLRTVKYEAFNYSSDTVYTIYDFRYDEKKVVINRFDKNQKMLKSATKEITDFELDAMTLFYFARFQKKGTNISKLQIWNDFVKESTSLKVDTKPELVEAENLNRSILTHYVSGKADINGLYGLSGKFSGYFSDDSFSVPVLAKLNVLIGSVTCKLVEYKSKLSCCKCGENHPACLHFHHRDKSTKSFSISDSIRRFSLEKIIAEIAKCDVLCANCHAKLHYDERVMGV